MLLRYRFSRLCLSRAAMCPLALPSLTYVAKRSAVVFVCYLLDVCINSILQRHSLRLSVVSLSTCPELLCMCYLCEGLISDVMDEDVWTGPESRPGGFERMHTPAAVCFAHAARGGITLLCH